MAGFYGPEQAAIHHGRFGNLAARAADHVLALLDARGVNTGTWVDLGCGSGILARAATDRGFEVVGVDRSADMLALARAQAPDAQLVQASAFDVELPPCVAVTATGEVLGYLDDGEGGAGLPDRLGRLVERVRGVLSPDGVLAFDLAGPGRLGSAGPVQRVHQGDHWLLTMEADEDPDVAELERQVTIFTEQDLGCWRRVDELQRLRLMAPAEVLAQLGEHGFEARVLPDYGDGEGLPGWAVFEAKPSPG